MEYFVTPIFQAYRTMNQQIFAIRKIQTTLDLIVLTFMKCSLLCSFNSLGHFGDNISSNIASIFTLLVDYLIKR
ncbi:CLUMA_CG013612, isoform A [Clunio marinus]|uniref:CLUMA_CG013612, isoform A n=1 Tax=Clunio marinus TaxID=568069 RepID=A0A1J1IJD3_9DIPT|nr:CLUMA_CG013612, isoform A [Clunio marinus]